MGKIQGRVRNFLVDNLDMFIDVFERTLCREQVSYVRVENEFHCMDKIFRFYDIKQYQELCDLISFVGQEESMIKLVDSFTMSLARDIDDIDKALYLDEEVVCDQYFKEDNNVSHKLTKSSIKQGNMQTKQKLKSNRDYETRFINRNRKDL